MHDFVRRMSLTNITLVCQDWGGPITLRIVAADPDRFARVVVSNTALPDARNIPDEMAAKLKQLLADTPVLNTVEVNEAMRVDLHERGGFQDQARNAVADVDPRPPFMYWIRHCDASADLDPGRIMSLWLNSCSAEEQRAYAAPFPSEDYKQGARQFPSLIPLFPDNVESASKSQGVGGFENLRQAVPHGVQRWRPRVTRRLNSRRKYREQRARIT